jgi:hypothetical protein
MRLALVARLGVAALVASAGLVVVGAPAPVAAATSGCVTVDGAPAGGGGPQRATVVVDTGSGPVWSACISFSGSISGIEALERAEATIADLDPVYDQYAGLGKAVCRLRGVGTDPPDCLGKSTSYWSFSHNGRVAPVGAGAVTVRDGDVQGWRYGTGGSPRAASAGTRASTAPPPTTTTTRPPTPTTRVPAPTTPQGGGLSGSPSGGPSSGTTPAGAPVDGSTGDGAPTTTAGPGTPGDGGETTTTAADGSTPDGAADGGDDGTEVEGEAQDATVAAASADDGGDDGSDESAAGVVPEGAGGSASGGSSSAGSIAGFAIALALVGAAGVLVRRRRTTPSPA